MLVITGHLLHNGWRQVPIPETAVAGTRHRSSSILLSSLPSIPPPEPLYFIIGHLNSLRLMVLENFNFHNLDIHGPHGNNSPVSISI